MITSNLVDAANKEAAKEKTSAGIDKIQIQGDVLPGDRKVVEPANVIFKLVKKKKGRLWLDNCCDNVPNPKKQNIPERIWLLNGAHSIWDNEIENILKDKDRYNRARRGRDIIFIDGICRVPSSDILMLEFMRLNRHNIGDRKVGSGKFDFYEYSPAKEQEERNKKQMLKIQMILKAGEMDFSEKGYGRKIASFLGVPMVDETGFPFTADGLKTELMLKVDSDPSTFQKYLDSEEVIISYYVRRAISDAKIDLGGESRSVTWAQGKGYIAKIPVDRKAYEYLTELALTNSDEGRKFKEQLKQISS